MKALRVRRLMLFPRFHVSVKDSLEAQQPEVGFPWMMMRIGDAALFISLPKSYLPGLHNLAAGKPVHPR